MHDQMQQEILWYLQCQLENYTQKKEQIFALTIVTRIAPQLYGLASLIPRPPLAAIVT